MNGQEKSDPAIVAERPTNEAGRPAEEPAEPRAGAEGNANQQSAFRTQRRVDASQRWSAYGQPQRFAVNHPRWEPYAGIPPVRFCAGGAQQ